MRRGLIAALALIVLALHATRYYPFLADDALISLRYSQRLLDGHGLTWTDGPRVEGYSNPTWVLAVAALGALGIDLIVAARLLGAVGSAAAILAVVWWFRPTLSALTASLSLALAGPVAVWTVGGLEQPLLIGLLAWATVWLLSILDDPAPRTLVAVGAVYGVLAVSRPDGVLFVLAAAITLVVLGRWRGAGFLLAVPAALLVAQLSFRLWYYDDWVPNTAYAKVGFAAGRVLDGVDYVATGLIGMAGLVVPAVAAVVLLWRDPLVRPRLVLLGTSLVMWLGYVAVVGGDTFPGRRQLAVAVVLLALLGGELWRAHPRAWGLAALSLAVLAAGQLGVDPQYPRAAREQWEWECRDVARTLGRGLADDQPLLAVSTAGCLPYWSELPALDLLGLNDRYLAHHRPPTMGQGSFGHELGDADYTLRRAPDLVMFCGPDGSATGCHDVERALLARPEFRERYRLVEVDGALVWVRREGGRVGVERNTDRIRIPGVQFGLVVESARFDADVPAGRWQAEVDATGPVTVEVDDDGSVTVTAVDGPVDLRSVTLTRV